MYNLYYIFLFYYYQYLIQKLKFIPCIIFNIFVTSSVWYFKLCSKIGIPRFKKNFSKIGIFFKNINILFLVVNVLHI